MQEIETFIIQKYHPDVLIVYGSYADGSNNEGSDFDALAIADIPAPIHDVSITNGVQLDLFVYPHSHFESEFEPEEVLQICDGRIVIDHDGTGHKLISSVQGYIANLPVKAKEQNEEQLEWCRKMLLRAQRGDAEGFYRWHWLLCDSLEIYCDIMEKYYFGPKKAIRQMEREDPTGFEIYSAALKAMDSRTLTNWIDYLCRQNNYP